MTLGRWLKAHPEVEFVSRDRAVAYAEAATKAAPQAVQIADRFHLTKNLLEAFEGLIQGRSAVLREAGRAVSLRYQTEVMLRAEGLLEALPGRMAKRPKAPSPLRERKRADRLARYQECHRLKRLGLSLRAIGRRLGLHHATVRNFLRHETFPERVEYPPRSQTTER